MELRKLFAVLLLLPSEGVAAEEIDLLIFRLFLAGSYYPGYFWFWLFGCVVFLFFFLMVLSFLSDIDLGTHFLILKTVVQIICRTY